MMSGENIVVITEQWKYCAIDFIVALAMIASQFFLNISIIGDFDGTCLIMSRLSRDLFNVFASGRIDALVVHPNHIKQFLQDHSLSNEYVIIYNPVSMNSPLCVQLDEMRSIIKSMPCCSRHISVLSDNWDRLGLNKSYSFAIESNVHNTSFTNHLQEAATYQQKQLYLIIGNNVHRLARMHVGFERSIRDLQGRSAALSAIEEHLWASTTEICVDKHIACNERILQMRQFINNKQLLFSDADQIKLKNDSYIALPQAPGDVVKNLKRLKLTRSQGFDEFRTVICSNSKPSSASNVPSRSTYRGCIIL